MKGKAQQTESSNKTIRRYQSAKPGKQDPSALLKESDALALQRAIVHPTVAGPANILALQRAAGNRAVTGLIQTKLTVGAPGDRYEREADRVAEQVVSSQRGVQRQAEEELQTKPLAASLTPLIQCQAE
jgi:hypothetical protein